MIFNSQREREIFKEGVELGMSLSGKATTQVIAGTPEKIKIHKNKVNNKKKVNHKWNDEEIEKLLRMTENNMKVPEIAEHFGISTFAAMSAVKRFKKNSVEDDGLAKLNQHE